MAIECGKYEPPTEGHGRWGCLKCGYSKDSHPVAADPAQSAPSAEPRKVTGGLGGKFYLSPDGNWIIWDQQPSEYADAAHRGLFHALKEAKTRAETAESALRQKENLLALYRAKRESDGGPGRVWDSGKHLIAEEAIAKAEAVAAQTPEEK